MYKINLIPSNKETKLYIKNQFNEDIKDNDILCYKNIIYRDQNEDFIADECIFTCKVDEFGKTPIGYTPTEDEEYFSYEIMVPIFSNIESNKFIDFSYILDNSEDNIKYFLDETENLLLLYCCNEKKLYCTIAEKEEVLKYNNSFYQKYLLINGDMYDNISLKLIEESCLMTEILDNCNSLIQENPDNCDDFEEKESCIQCVRNSYRERDIDTYSCLKKLCHYTIFYGPIYVSEIYHFLTQSQILENYIAEHDDQIYIMSLGCGFGPDNIALNKYITANHLNMDFSYIGYDIEPLWADITVKTTPNIPEVKNIIDGFDCNNIDIIFMNKVFSTLKNNRLNEDFLDTFKIELENFPTGSLVIFNDINHRNEGRDEFNTFAIKNSLRSIGKYYYPIANAYTDNYTKMESSHNICEIPDSLTSESKDTPTQLVFFVYEKIEED